MQGVIPSYGSTAKERAVQRNQNQRRQTKKDVLERKNPSIWKQELFKSSSVALTRPAHLGGGSHPPLSGRASSSQCPTNTSFCNRKGIWAPQASLASKCEKGQGREPTPWRLTPHPQCIVFPHFPLTKLRLLWRNYLTYLKRWRELINKKKKEMGKAENGGKK